MAIGATVVRPNRAAIRARRSAAAFRENVSTRMLSGGRAAAFDPIHHALDQGRGLAGAGSGQHQQRSPGVLDDGTLRLGPALGVWAASPPPESSGTSRPSWSRDDQPYAGIGSEIDRQIGAHRAKATRRSRADVAFGIVRS